MPREKAYGLVQRNAMRARESGGDFLDKLLADSEIRSVLSAEELRAQFDLSYHTKHVDTIFDRVFGFE
jgi:adenylosuccinate lyase